MTSAWYQCGKAISRCCWNCSEDRHQRGGALVANQLPIKLWNDQLTDPTLAHAILDRLVHNVELVELSGESILNEAQKTSIDNDRTTLPARPQTPLSADRRHWPPMARSAGFPCAETAASHRPERRPLMIGISSAYTHGPSDCVLRDNVHSLRGLFSCIGRVNGPTRSWTELE